MNAAFAPPRVDRIRTRDLGSARRIGAGTIRLNGGVKQSGLGREGELARTEVETVAVGF